MFNRKKIKELEEKVAYYQELFAKELRYTLENGNLYKRIWHLLQTKLVPTLEAKELAQLFATYPVVRSCGRGSCTWAVKIPVEDLNKYLDVPVQVPNYHVVYDPVGPIKDGESMAPVEALKGKGISPSDVQ